MVSILDDSFALCIAGQLLLSSLLSWMDVYKHELDYIVLSRLIAVMLEVLKLTSCAIGNSFNKLKQYFISLLEISAEATYTTVVRSINTGDKHGLELLLKLYRETDVAQEKARILSALASSPDPDIVVEALNFLLSSEIRDQDIIYGLRGISLEGSETAWRWLKDNWEFIMDRWGHHFLLTHFIRDIVIPCYSEVRTDEIEEFFLVHTKPSIAMMVKQSLEQARINAKWAMNVAKEKNLGELITQLPEKNTKKNVLVED
ncbi:putative membrane alanyl aminopeptidase [Dioscorea sansibarensis]